MGLLDSVLGNVVGAALGGGGGAGGALGGAGGAVLMQVIGSLLGGHAGQGGGGTAGLGALLQQLQQAGLGEQAQSWVSTGQNLPVSGDQLQAALGGDRIGALAEQTGLAPDALAGQLAQVLPQVVDRLTPGGQLPADGATPPLGDVLGGLLGSLLKG